MNVEDAGSNVDDPAVETHEPEVDDPVRIVWTSTDDERSVIVCEYVIPAGEDP